MKQLGFCRVCGNSVLADQEFTETDDGFIHESCL
ncbi:MAG: DUF2175 family protein [Candidatus Nanohaloarchaea archaeon]